MALIDSLISDWSMRPSPESGHGQAWEMGARQGWQWAIEQAARIADEWDHGGDSGIAMYASPRIRNRIKALLK